METSYSGVCFHFRFHVFAFAEQRSRGLGLAGRGKGVRAERKEERGDDAGCKRGRK